MLPSALIACLPTMSKGERRPDVRLRVNVGCFAFCINLDIESAWDSF